ncbi:cobalamin B12-binding domain-containing protein [Limibaculum sp. FT325]|uniref:cobalamin B12-binding domain-containing protein n=1 Tax=Thermohalobaculum sediminis TaxID=2939436 RepID=UPI0020BFE262|nr:cobalamin B12-binding domain-containing protein [Limibaculum sediminis]MCL5776137.1 cobalamin B12-binding domain-containing protein [Limibaculum sediminis]
MQHADALVSGFDRDAYEEIIDEFSDLRTRLPRRTLELVSREVVARLKARYEHMNTAVRNVGEADIHDLCIALISEDHQEASRFVALLYDRGVLLESIYLGYLAAATARLGEWWEADRVTLADVHLAAGRILVIMKSLKRAQPHVTTDVARRATFALVPGEQHSVGLTMAAELCRRTGWQISVLNAETHDGLLAEIEREDCGFVGLSASGLRSHQALARLIAALRVWKPGLFIVVGGQLAQRFPQMVGRLGANALASDPLEAINRMEEAMRGNGSGNRRFISEIGVGS